ncbi:MAG: peptidylprolyl isomerase [Acidobacteria bacterium]|nr:peptidylprolyl isomerase [Acidobacteriota bacterium]
MKKVTSFILFISMVLLLLININPVFAQGQEEKDVEHIIAKINNVVITSSDLDTAIEEFKKSSRTPMSDKELKMKAYEGLMLSRLVTSISDLLQYKVDDEAINNRIEQIKKENGIESDEMFSEMLKKEGLSIQWLKERLEQSFRYQVVITRNVLATIKITDEEIKDYYNRNIRDFSEPGNIRISQVFISTSDRSEEDAKNLANEISAKIKGGLGFTEAVRLYSDDKTNDGDLGFFAEGELIKELSDSAFKMNAGDVSEVIKTDNGYHIIQVTEKKIAKTIPLKDVRAQIVDKLRFQRLPEAEKEYIKTLQKEFYVEILDPELKALYEEQEKKEGDNESKQQ